MHFARVGRRKKGGGNFYRFFRRRSMITAIERVEPCCTIDFFFYFSRLETLCGDNVYLESRTINTESKSFVLCVKIILNKFRDLVIFFYSILNTMNLNMEKGKRCENLESKATTKSSK